MARGSAISGRGEVVSGRGTQVGALDTLPGTSMFNDPFLHYSAESLDLSNDQEPTTWTDQLNDTDASSVGSPTYKSDQSGRPAVLYDGADDGHDLVSPPSFPSGSVTVSFATTLYIPSANSGYVFWYGVKGSDGLSLEIQSDGTARLNASNTGDPGHDTSYPTGEWFTLGGSIHGSNDEWTVYVNDMSSTAPYKDPNVDDSNHSMMYRTDGTDKWANAYLYDLVISGVDESDQSFIDYYNDRI